MSVNTFRFSDNFSVVTVLGNYVRVDKVYDASSIEEVVRRIVDENDIDNERKSIMIDTGLVDDYIKQYLTGNPILIEGLSVDSTFDKMFISVIED